MGNKKLYLIDATAFCYRAFYAIKALSSSDGQPTNAVYGFVNILNKILKNYKPDYIAACFDVSRDTFRSRKFAEYKMQRPAMPENLGSQIPIIREVIEAYGIAMFQQAGFEADDIISQLSRDAVKNKLKVVIVSSDKDMLQLVDENIEVLRPDKEGGVVYDAAKVKAQFGVAPERIVDIIALMGDSADNIPGVPGVGEKTAERLIREFTSLEKMLQDIGRIKPDKLRESIKANLARIKLNKELASLGQAMDLEFDLNKLIARDPDYVGLSKIFKRLEFKSLLKALPHQAEAQEDIKFAGGGKQELRDILSGLEEIVVCGASKDNLVFCAGNKFYHFDPRGKIHLGLLADRQIKKTGHDLKKLKVALAKDGLLLEGLNFDTMIAAYLLNPSKPGYKLTDLAFDYLGQLPQGQEPEPAQAANLVIKLKPVLEGQLKDKGLIGLFNNLEMPLAEVLSGMEEAGIKIDVSILKDLSRQIERRLVKLVSGIYASSGREFNINSPKQLGEVLFVNLKLPVIKKTKTGPSTNEEVLRALSGRHALPALLLEYRQLAKLKNTYIDALPLLVDPKSGRIHTLFNQTGTETGRLSSSNPNLQNIPAKTDIGKNIRRAIVASDKNHCLLSCDYSQIELRILAELCADQALIKAFEQGADIHRFTAALVYGANEDAVSDQMREVAKRVNFGIVYGQSAYGLSKDLDIPIAQAQDFIDAYFLRYPKVKVYIEQQIEKAAAQGFVTTLLGRRRYIPEINNKNQGLRQFAQRQAVNTPIQGSASDLIKLAMVKIARSLEERGLAAKMILQIHDELVFELPCSELKELGALAKDTMEHVLALRVPLKVAIKKGSNWLEMEPVE